MSTQDIPELAGIAELAAALSALEGLPPLERARQCGLLSVQCRAVLAGVRKAAMAEALAGGMSQADLARELDVSPKQVSKLAGERREGRGRPRKS